MIIYLMIGAPGAGKSTYVKNVFPGMEILSCDEIREKKFGAKRSLEIREVVLNEMLEYIIDRCKKMESLVIDTTYFNQIENRVRLFGVISPKNINVIYIDTTVDICLQQNKLRDGARVIEDHMIKYLHDNIDPPNQDEGFYSITHIPC